MTAAKTAPLTAESYPVDQWDWHGTPFSVGDTVTYDVTKTTAQNQRDVERHTGQIRELYVDPWWGSIHPGLFAEIDTPDGEERAWFGRDHVAHADGLNNLPTIEGALF